jgi:AcrR family transcriptional regulator
MQGFTQTEQLLCDGLIELLQKRPLSKISVVDLVHHVGVSRSTFYNYFDSIYDVLQKVEDSFFEELESRVYSSVMQMNYKEYVPASQNLHSASFNFVKDWQKVIRALMGPTGDPAFVARFKHYVQRLVANYCDFAGVDISPVKKEFLSAQTAGASVQILLWVTKLMDSLSETETQDLIAIALELSAAMIGRPITVPAKENIPTLKKDIDSAEISGT